MLLPNRWEREPRLLLCLGTTMQGGGGREETGILLADILEFI